MKAWQVRISLRCGTRRANAASRALTAPMDLPSQRRFALGAAANPALASPHHPRASAALHVPQNLDGTACAPERKYAGTAAAATARLS